MNFNSLDNNNLVFFKGNEIAKLVKMLFVSYSKSYFRVSYGVLVVTHSRLILLDTGNHAVFSFACIFKALIFFTDGLQLVNLS